MRNLKIRTNRHRIAIGEIHKNHNTATSRDGSSNLKDYCHTNRSVLIGDARFRLDLFDSPLHGTNIPRRQQRGKLPLFTRLLQPLA